MTKEKIIDFLRQKQSEASTFTNDKLEVWKQAIMNQLLVIFPKTGEEKKESFRLNAFIRYYSNAPFSVQERESAQGLIQNFIDEIELHGLEGESKNQANAVQKTEKRSDIFRNELFWTLIVLVATGFFFIGTWYQQTQQLIDYKKEHVKSIKKVHK